MASMHIFEVQRLTSW